MKARLLRDLTPLIEVRLFTLMGNLDSIHLHLVYSNPKAKARFCERSQHLMTRYFGQSSLSTLLLLLLVHARDDAAINLETLTRKGRAANGRIVQSPPPPLPNSQNSVG